MQLLLYAKTNEFKLRQLLGINTANNNNNAVLLSVCAAFFLLSNKFPNTTTVQLYKILDSNHPSHPMYSQGIERRVRNSGILFPFRTKMSRAKIASE